MAIDKLRNLADMNVSGEEAAKANKEIMQMVDKDDCKGSPGITYSVQASV